MTTVISPLGEETPEAAVRRPIIARPILIVDDDPRSRLLTTTCLAGLGLSNPTIELSDGDQAVAALRASLGPMGVLPVLVLLDLNMPRHSGTDVLRWMRATPVLRHVPVVVLTSDDNVHSVTTLYGLDVHSYLVKPVGFDALGAVVRDLELPWMLT